MDLVIPFLFMFGVLVAIWLIARAITPRVKPAHKPDPSAHVRFLEQRLTTLRQDQARLRANLKIVPPDSEVHQRYVKKLDTQETEIERIQEAIKRFQERQLREHKDFEAFRADLNAE